MIYRQTTSGPQGQSLCLACDSLGLWMISGQVLYWTLASSTPGETAGTSQVLCKGKGREARRWGSSPFIQALMLDIDYGSYPVSYHNSNLQVFSYS